MNVKKIITLLLALVLAAGMVACGTKPAEDTDGKDGNEEAKALYEQLMAQENAILSENTALWEKLFMAADKGMAMIEDGGNCADFLLKTIENAKGQFTEEELTLLTGGRSWRRSIPGCQRHLIVMTIRAYRRAAIGPRRLTMAVCRSFPPLRARIWTATR